MKLVYLLGTLLMCLVACSQQNNAPEKELVFTSVNVIPMDQEVVLKNKDVLIRNGIITDIADAGKIKYTKEAKVINAKGRYLMPGLAEMHAHVPPTDNLEEMKEVLLLFAANGVTTIRGMLGHPKHLELREKIKNRSILGPELYTSGPSANGNSTPTPEAAIRLVQEQKAAGYDFIKIHPGIELEAFKALARTAQNEGIPFAGHVPSDVGIWNAIELGILTIDHLDGFMEALMPGQERFKEGAHGLFAIYQFQQADTSHIEKLMKALLRHKVWVVPTQALAVRWLSLVRSAMERSKEPEMQYMDPKTVANWVTTKEQMESNNQFNKDAMNRYIALRNQLIKACQQYGVPLLLGSDAPQVFNVPGFSVHHELQYMVDAGLTPYQALKAGTVNVGKFYKNPQQGIIKAGAVADLILLNGNPLQDIHQVTSIEGVVLKGQWLDKEWKVTTLKNIAESNKP